MLKHIFLFILICLAIAAGAFFYLSRGDTARLSVAELSGREPQLTAPRKEFIPTANIAKAVGWKANEKPVAPKGLMVERFADGLAHPQPMLRLGTGAILVAEPGRPMREVGGFHGLFLNLLWGQGGGS